MRAATPSSAVLVVGAIGIVYGDIGTSVLYALKEVFAAGRVPLTAPNVYGVLSLLFWTLTGIVTLKYITLILRADNRGEGGLVAMLALASNAVRDRPRTRNALLAVGVLGASLFYGDGVITPAISVLSAIEGLELVAPSLHAYVVPMTLAVLWLLFWVQKYGTAGIARYFGPVMVLWFVTIGGLGAAQLVQEPDVLRAIIPTYAWGFAFHQPEMAFLILGALVLCVTGAEALYADMGHFGRRPIRLAWFLLVMPALTLNYFGQGALVLADPGAVKNPFFLLAPGPMLMPLVAISTVATVIASQALISGAFSVTKQLMQLGYLPRLRIRHTSTEVVGQIYIPFVNWTLFIAVALSVAYFRNSGALASAYGLAVCGLMLITTVLTFYVIRYSWRLPLMLCVLPTGLFLSIDLIFLSSAILKIPTGGWYPLLLAGGLFALMTSWYRGQLRLKAARRSHAVELQPLLASIFLAPPQRVPGTAVFLTGVPQKTPTALLHNLKHNKVLHARNVFLTLTFQEQPRVSPEARTEVYPLGHDCFQVIMRYGYMDDPDVPRDLALIDHPGLRPDGGATSYFIGRDTVMPSSADERVARWESKIFVHMHRNASAISEHLKLPGNAVVELGALVEI